MNKDCRNKDAGLWLEEMIVRNSKNTWNVLARACTHQQLTHMAGTGDCGDSQIEPRPSTLTDRSWMKEPGGSTFYLLVTYITSCYGSHGPIIDGSW